MDSKSTQTEQTTTHIEATKEQIEERVKFLLHLIYSYHDRIRLAYQELAQLNLELTKYEKEYISLKDEWFKRRDKK